MSTDANNIVGLYDRNADAWDIARGKSLFEAPWLDRFLSLVPLGGTILDIGCGSGEPIARHFAARGYRVTGVDSSENLIALCRARMPDHDWHVADMRRLSLGRTFGGLIAWDSFFHLVYDDQRAMFPVFGAHAVPGAPLLFTSGPGHGEAMGTFEGEPLYHASLDPEEYRSLLTANGFDVLAFKPEDPACGGHTVWLAQRADRA
ncbi:methyltransferase domain-containing protein [Rhizobium sp. TH2]|uniref:class I SAM-dependent DNA methyltransferase n=1 Tax=Rhizobium sp. TH2 TaxID=2775403 RepID=UPI002157EC77|nr:class I SAM-dependent methyltransferase [Rhizobium sp. TH2]UVC09493.1 methyltransferase domain-containing protein [Rhizobium sp. TH2]